MLRLSVSRSLNTLSRLILPSSLRIVVCMQCSTGAVAGTGMSGAAQRTARRVDAQGGRAGGRAVRRLASPSHCALHAAKDQPSGTATAAAHLRQLGHRVESVLHAVGRTHRINHLHAGVGSGSGGGGGQGARWNTSMHQFGLIDKPTVRGQ